MEYQFLESRIENRILRITLSRENQLNALNKEMIRELRAIFESVDKENLDVRGVVITGKGDKAFAAGADIKELTSIGVDEAYVLSQEGHTTFDLIEGFRIPVVAAINGYALGGGFEIALACHIRIAASTARMGLPESSLGLIPGYGGTQRLTQVIGRAKAIEMMCSGEMIDAIQALDMGILSYVTPPGEVVPKAVEIIEKMTRNSPESTSKILEASLMNLTQPDDGYRFERKTFAEILQTENAREGINAFLEKRKPTFKT